MAASALYACTKCTQRYPFEELSQGQQLCKVRGLREEGGMDVLGRSRRGPGSRCTAAPLSLPAPRGFGSLVSPPPHSGTPFSGGLNISWERPLRGRQNRALFQAARAGAEPRQRLRGLRGGVE